MSTALAMSLIDNCPVNGGHKYVSAAVYRAIPKRKWDQLVSKWERRGVRLEAMNR